MKILRILLFLSLGISLSGAFTTHHNHGRASTQTPALPTVANWQARKDVITGLSVRSSKYMALSSSSQVEEEEGPSWGVNPIYGTLYLALLVFAFGIAPGEVGSAQDQTLIENYIANPLAPEGFSTLYLTIFDMLGIIPIIATCVALPQGSKKGLPAAPFLASSTALGYLGAGPYFVLRAPPRERVVTSELSWFTRNVVENKIFNWGLVAFVAYTYYVTGFVTALSQDGLGQLWQDFVASSSTSKFISVSAADAVIYSLAIAVLIAKDYKLRNLNANDTTASLVGGATLFLPFLGSALYCALRPKLPEY